MLTDKFKKNADALRHKKLFLLDMDGTISIMKIQFLKERWIFFPRLKKMEDAIFSSPTIPPNP